MPLEQGEGEKQKLNFWVSCSIMIILCTKKGKTAKSSLLTLQSFNILSCFYCCFCFPDNLDLEYCLMLFRKKMKENNYLNTSLCFSINKRERASCPAGLDCHFVSSFITRSQALSNILHDYLHKLNNILIYYTKTIQMKAENKLLCI